MNVQNAFQCVVLRRFFKAFQSITYHGVPLCKYIYYYPFYRSFLITPWNIDWAKEKFPNLLNEMSQLTESDVYACVDEPYLFEPHPDGIILMRGGFGDIASQYLPKDKFFLISPTQAEVDLIKTNWPDMDVHCIERYYRENPKAVATLNKQVARVIGEHKNDPMLGSPELLQWFNHNMPEFVRLLDAAQWLFENFKVSSVLTISSNFWLDSALNLIARANKIASLTLQHGVIGDTSLFCHLPILTTKKLVWGKADLQWYQRYGYPESRLSVIGAPRFDIIFNKEWCGRKKLRQMLGINSSEKVVVYATSGDAPIIISVVLNGLKSISDLFLLMTLHPSEGSLVKKYQELTEDYPNSRVVRYGEISLYDSLSGADFFITHCSTSGLEAMLFKLPLITVETIKPHFSYGDLGISIRVTSAAELNQVIQRMITDETFKNNAINRCQEFVPDYCLPDGLATKRLFNELEQISHSGGTV
jgi:hypothetical protein